MIEFKAVVILYNPTTPVRSGFDRGESQSYMSSLSSTTKNEENSSSKLDEKLD